MPDQTQQQPQQPWEMPGTGNATPDNERPDDFRGTPRDELIAAVREAGGTAEVDLEAEERDAAERAANPPPPKPAPAAPAQKTAPAAAETPDPNAIAEPKIAAAIRAREEARKKVDEATDYSVQLRQQAETEAQRILADARRTATEQLQAERDRFLNRYRESPTSALREAGIPTDKLVNDVNLEGTPEWQAIMEARRAGEEAKTELGAAKKQLDELTAWRKSEADRQQAESVARVQQQFLDTHATTEKAPFMHKRWEPSQIFDECNKLAVEWQKAGIQFAHADVAEYLEFKSRQRILGDAAAQPPQQVSGVAGQPAGIAPKVTKANGTRTLSAATGSERRAAPKPIREMTPEEEREALIAETRELRRKMGNPDV